MKGKRTVLVTYATKRNLGIYIDEVDRFETR